MSEFLTKHGSTLRSLCLLLMMLIPFLLYFVARSGSEPLLYALLGLLAGVMALTMKVG